MFKLLPFPSLLLLLLLLLPFLSVKVNAVKNDPLSPKSSLIRYWNRQIPSNRPQPDFLLSKASPLTTTNSAILQKFADQKALSSHLQSFCESAHLFCFPDQTPSLAKNDGEAKFSQYESGRNFSNYGTSAVGESNSFKNYSDSVNLPLNQFTRYGRQSVGHDSEFANYAPDGNVADESFGSYSVSATGGSAQFSNYDHGVNAPDLRFTTYDSDGNGRTLGFTSYADGANAGDQNFKSYGKRGNGEELEFTSYGRDSNVVGSTFVGYGEGGNGAADNFTSYGSNGNVPENNFRSYGDGGNGATESFTGYRDQSNVGDDSFTTYQKGSNSVTQFSNYGKSFNEGSDSFKGYKEKTDFKGYGVNNTFKDYSKTGVTFSRYTNRTASSDEMGMTQMGKSGMSRWVEPGRFFRESMLKQGTVMPMPDIRDKMPRRSFLPRSLAAKMPFSVNQLQELKEIFHGSEENSAMGSILEKTLKECERVPSKGETKRCVTSIEDMIDFAVSVLGRNVTVKSTENVAGSKGDIEIGRVVGLNGGRVTKSVSCHESLFPYLVYFCHSVPKVKVYEAEILDVKKKERINRGVAICHIDTSMWGAGHGAFVALGGKPGEIEVCHWIFENDMTWVVAD
ncbi:hypothetical protein MRB53_031496 [Persea americana]|uniref:Uncharacterized protein n=1 Tax=Persea americana TaxID=3435 RepID=A0ACC2KQB6_PERAE|nr:hypothetical protein MRB53_031496 [Persea americana]|eukprot:TRINITY_DN40098_c0_g1_i1.p1 TRINITY_DN40098_c0_g1~~TRINITY_DN40098_c0_g1_i1.p1  ORF type:complete len:622 (-),score=27.41 TRINITY_DN40098_c0_g1_i1:339-2204(-)